MRYTHLGRTGLVVSRLALGTMNFGHVTDEAASHAIMDRAVEAGIKSIRYGRCLWRSPDTGYPERIRNLGRNHRSLA